MKLGNVTKTEKCLLGFAAAFLCLVTALYVRDAALPDQSGAVAVETEQQVDADALGPVWEPVDINTAAAETLDTLPGIGPALAERIIAYREAHGPFERGEELMEVKGIGEATYEGLADWITVEGKDKE